jgi:hypothetical protein
MDRERTGARDAPGTDATPAPAVAPPFAAAAALSRPSSPEALIALQQSAGNRAVGQIVARQPTAPAPSTAPTEPFELGGYTIATYGDAAVVLRAWVAILGDDAKELTDGGLPVPPTVGKVTERGQAYVKVLEGGGTEPLDRGNADDMRAYYASWVEAVNAARGVQADEVARRARAAAAELVEVQAKLDAMVPILRDTQRAKFRSGDEDGLLATADAIANVLDTSLVTKSAIDQAIEFASDMRQLVGTGAGKGLMNLAGKTQVVLNVLEKIDKAWAVFQLARAAVDLVTGGKTEAEGGRKAVGAMATTISAGGTLLGASTGFTLYSNLYIGPMTAACLSMLAKVEDLISKGDNRTAMQLGRFDWVNWSLEPGGRPMFDFMLALMHAESADAVPMPSGAVKDYLVDQEDDVNAGVGHKGEDLPTEGHWFWRSTDDSKLKGWAFRNRANLWGMLYGAAEVPSGRREI